MSTNPQSPQGSPTEGRGQSSLPDKNFPPKVAKGPNPQSPAQPTWCQKCYAGYYCTKADCPQPKPFPADAPAPVPKGLEEARANQISDARNTYIEGYIAGWGDTVTHDVMVMAMKAWDSSQSRVEIEALAAPGAPQGGAPSEGEANLWGLLDDIDTLSDAMKPEKTPYYMAVQKLAAQRFKVLTSDGYNLFRATQAPASPPLDLDPKWPEDREAPPRGIHRDLWRSLHDLCRIVRSTSGESIRSHLEAYLAGSFDEFGAKVEQAFSDRPPEDTPIEAAEEEPPLCPCGSPLHRLAGPGYYGCRKCGMVGTLQITPKPRPQAGTPIEKAARAVVDAQEDLRNAAADVDPEDGPEMYASALSIVSERESDLEKEIDKLGQALSGLPQEPKEGGQP